MLPDPNGKKFVSKKQKPPKQGAFLLEMTSNAINKKY